MVGFLPEPALLSQRGPGDLPGTYCSPSRHGILLLGKFHPGQGNLFSRRSRGPGRRRLCPGAVPESPLPHRAGTDPDRGEELLCSRRRGPEGEPI